MSETDLGKQDLNRLRNAIHNEAGITKQEIREMVEQAVEHLVDKKVKQILPDRASVDRLVDNAIEDRTLWYMDGDKKFGDRVQEKVAQKLVKKINVSVGLK